ncbi:hypothetical protein [Streptomyces avicenniae]|uniref:hypothetical protein n=1 Tax=Streptomyces avicenniae TaxID=500153 RepID=UPI00167E6FEB|nr:hypothetical protein [Streptomyces avicenniae]
MGAGPALRLAHAALYATVCVVVSGLGHVLSAGDGLPPSSVAVAFAVTCGAGWWLAGAGRDLRLIAGVSALGQAALHAVFSGLHPLPPAAPAAPRPVTLPAQGHEHGHGHHGGHSHLHDPYGPGAAPDPAAAEPFVPLLDGAYAGAGMVLAHGLAGLLCGWWLWRGEAAVRQTARSVALFLYAPLRAVERARTGVPPLPRVSPPPAPRPARRPRDLLALHGVSRRGPPSLSS